MEGPYLESNVEPSEQVKVSPCEGISFERTLYGVASVDRARLPCSTTVILDEVWRIHFGISVGALQHFGKLEWADVERVVYPWFIDFAEAIHGWSPIELGLIGRFLDDIPQSNDGVPSDREVMYLVPEGTTLTRFAPTVPWFAAPRSGVGVARSLLIIARQGMQRIALDAALLDDVVAVGSDLILSVDELEVALYVADGEPTTQLIAERLAPYLRGAIITTPQVYDDAKRRLQGREETDYALLVGLDAVTVHGDELHVGATVLQIPELREEALAGHTLQLPDGPLQAALALLIVAAEEREGGREDPTLAQRIADYEARLEP
jgi:hypothetical protein